MNYDALVAQLRTLKLNGMADVFEQQLEQPATHDDLSFQERLLLLIDREIWRAATRASRAYSRRHS